MLTWGLIVPSPYTFLARQSHFSHLSQKSFAQRKEMTFDMLSRYITVFCAFLCRFYSIYCAVILHYLPAIFVKHLYVFSVTCCQPFR